MTTRQSAVRRGAERGRSIVLDLAVRDAGQLRLLARLRARTDPNLRWRVEVPVIELPTAGSVESRARDAAIDGPGWSAPSTPRRTSATSRPCSAERG